jgi:hypothetical protein
MLRGSTGAISEPGYDRRGKSDKFRNRDYDLLAVHDGGGGFIECHVDSAEPNLAVCRIRIGIQDGNGVTEILPRLIVVKADDAPIDGFNPQPTGEKLDRDKTPMLPGVVQLVQRVEQIIAALIGLQAGKNGEAADISMIFRFWNSAK